jgi:hypothetical protein
MFQKATAGTQAWASNEAPLIHLFGRMPTIFFADAAKSKASGLLLAPTQEASLVLSPPPSCVDSMPYVQATAMLRVMQICVTAAKSGVLKVSQCLWHRSRSGCSFDMLTS